MSGASFHPEGAAFRTIIKGAKCKLDPLFLIGFFASGLSRMEGLWERGGNGMGAGTGTPFRDKPPRLSRKGALRAGSSINAPLRDNRGEGGGGACLERVCWVEFCISRFYKIAQKNSSFLFSLKVHRNPSNLAFICTQIGLIHEIFSFFVCKKDYFHWKINDFPQPVCVYTSQLLSPAPRKKNRFTTNSCHVTVYTSSQEGVCTSREESARGLLLLYTILRQLALFCYQKFLICSLFPLINGKCLKRYLKWWSELTLVPKRFLKFT